MNIRPRLLDLYCCAGGASAGYVRAGFDVTGVDCVPQPHYPFAFVQADALAYLAEHGHEYDAIHASPPCQGYSKLRTLHAAVDYPLLIEPTRDLLVKSGKPYVIENVEGAPLNSPLMLCGTMFGLQTAEGVQLWRHRLFETSFPIRAAFGDRLYCRHNKSASAIGVHGGGQHPATRRMPRSIGVYGHTGGSSRRDGLNRLAAKGFGIEARKQAMGIDWMVNSELVEAIPPAYTSFVGGWLMKYLFR